MITISDLKSTLSISSSAFNEDLQRALDTGYGYVCSTVSLSASGGIITEWHPRSDNLVYIKGRCNDAVLVSLTGYDYAFTPYTLSTTGDVDQVAPSMWRLKPTVGYKYYERYKIQYTSSQISAACDSIAREVAIYEFLKQPGQQGFISESVRTAGGVVSQSFKTNEEFYSGIRTRLAGLFVVAV